MKIFLNDTLIVKNNIDDVSNVIYNQNKTFINDANVQLISHHKCDWKLKHNLIQRKEYITLCVKDLPELFLKRLNNKDNHVKIKIVSVILSQEKDCYVIKTKCKIVNFSPLINVITSGINLIKGKCKITLKQINNITTEASFDCKVLSSLQMPKEFQEFILKLTKSVFETLNKELDKSI